MEQQSGLSFGAKLAISVAAVIGIGLIVKTISPSAEEQLAKLGPEPRRPIDEYDPGWAAYALWHKRRDAILAKADPIGAALRAKSTSY